MAEGPRWINLHCRIARPIRPATTQDPVESAAVPAIVRRRIWNVAPTRVTAVGSIVRKMQALGVPPCEGRAGPLLAGQSADRRESSTVWRVLRRRSAERTGVTDGR